MPRHISEVGTRRSALVVRHSLFGTRRSALGAIAGWRANPSTQVLIPRRLTASLRSRCLLCHLDDPFGFPLGCLQLLAGQLD